MIGNQDFKFWMLCDPSMTLLRRSYKKSMTGWRNERIRRIADELKVEIPHLCAVGGVFNRKQIEGYYERNRWPYFLILTFMRIESFLNQRGTGRREINPDDAAIAMLISRGAPRPEPDMRHLNGYPNGITSSPFPPGTVVNPTMSQLQPV